MSILIKNMRMPESCHVCIAGFGGFCYVAPAEEDGICPDSRKPNWCPLVEVPDKVIEDANKKYHCPFCGGKLSEPRYNGKYVARHCYSCHFDFQASYGFDKSKSPS